MEVGRHSCSWGISKGTLKNKLKIFGLENLPQAIAYCAASVPGLTQAQELCFLCAQRRPI
jgi:hypothetical protein